MTTIPAIPTRYRNVTFDSRTEADWACTLDWLGIAWQPHPGGVTLPSGVRYEPDFYLPECATWLEAKGPHNQRIQKTFELGATVAHGEDCTRRASTIRAMTFATLDIDMPDVERELKALTDGDTAVKVIVYRASGRGQTFKMRRQVAIDHAAIKLIAKQGAWKVHWEPIYAPDCCAFSITPRQMVVIGRPPIGDAADFASAQGGEVVLARCSACEKTSFLNLQYALKYCRICGSRDSFGDAVRAPASAPDGRGERMRFRRAPRPFKQG